MTLTLLLALLLALAVIGYILGRARAFRSAGGDGRMLHSRPHFYGWNVVMFTLAPALALLALWLMLQPMLLNGQIGGKLTEEIIPDGSSQSLIMAQIRSIAGGLDEALNQGILSQDGASALAPDAVADQLKSIGVSVPIEVTPELHVLVEEYRAKNATYNWIRAIAVLGFGLLGMIYALMRTHKDFRARNIVETGILVLLIAAASIAILTTVAIIFSTLFESIRFFGMHPAKDFFLGLKWAPNFRGDSELSILPLLWGTLYISLVALLVAVPIGLFAAIYLSEYAGSKTRSTVKPLLEVLAGIPTIVYGLFALTTFGPLLLGLFGKGGAFGIEWMGDARSVMTAGVVMGIMLIPFVSSLSDDIINSVPQALRDGSYGLGATQSETVKQVILPAALPGIMGAILLAASRAIGETMIVVMGAGAIARFSVNPFEALTTITTRIVAQLTGDGDFNSPETLVAFALGLTLFVLTLLLNILALYIVRKYREQYE